jgi:hypothetical protein
MTEERFPSTEYFRTVRTRPDRTIIDGDWIRQVIDPPVRVAVQADGGVRLWAAIAEAAARPSQGFA